MLRDLQLIALEDALQETFQLSHRGTQDISELTSGFIKAAKDHLQLMQDYRGARKQYKEFYGKAMPSAGARDVHLVGLQFHTAEATYGFGRSWWGSTGGGV